MNDLKASHFLVALPFIHVIAAATYISGYFFGFGANIAIFASASDLFSISVGELFAIYITAAVVPAMALVSRLSSNTPYAADIVERAHDDARPRIAASINRTRKIVLIFLGAITVTTISAVVVLYLRTGVFYATFLVIITSWITLWVWRINDKWNLSYIAVEFIAFLLGFFTCALIYGIASGQLDRHRSYSAAKDRVKCHGYALMKNFSNKYLSVDKFGNKFFVSEDCTVIFSVPPASPPVWK